MDPVSVKPGTARRRFSKEFKKQIVAQCEEPEASVSAIALANGLNTNQVFKWRRQYSKVPGDLPGRAELVPVHIVDAARPEVKQASPAPAAFPAYGHLEIKLQYGQVRVEGAVDPETLRVVIQCLCR